MKTKIAVFEGTAVSPIARTIPQSVAASIGRTIMRHSYMQWRQAKILYNLLGISIKQGRAADVRVPAPGRYVSIVKDLLLFHKVAIATSLNPVRIALEKADQARNVLAHSIFLQEGGELRIQIVRGNWELDQDVVAVSRALQPEGRAVNRPFLTEQRAAVDEGIRAIERLNRAVSRALDHMNELRETTDLNRRKAR